MTFHQLRIFKAVAEHGSVTRAASDLHVSQPCVSTQLKLLQGEFGVQFYTKQGQGIKLTKEGILFLDRIRAIVQQAEELQKLFTIRAGADRRTLEIATTQNAASAVLPQVLVDLKNTYPGLVFSVKSALSQVAERMVVDQEAEIGIIINPSYAYGTQIITEPFSFEEVVAVVSCKHPLAKKGEISPQELSAISSLVWKAGVIAKEVRNTGLKLNIGMECDSSEALKAAVASGLGLGFFFRNTVESSLRSKKFKRIRILGTKQLTIKSFIVYPGNRKLSPQALELIALLHQRAPKLKHRETVN
jgi:DNA-binding transcriptional LysR family regulator